MRLDLFKNPRNNVGFDRQNNDGGTGDGGKVVAPRPDARESFFEGSQRGKISSRRMNTIRFEITASQESSNYGLTDIPGSDYGDLM